MNNLRDNQILIENLGDKTSVQIGSYPKVEFSSCPDKPFENIQNSINSYMEMYDIPSNIEDWKPKGCFYKGTGSCKDCN